MGIVTDWSNRGQLRIERRGRVLLDETFGFGPLVNGGLSGLTGAPWPPLNFDQMVEGIITGGHGNTTARMISFYEGDLVPVGPLTTMLR